MVSAVVIFNQVSFWYNVTRKYEPFFNMESNKVLVILNEKEISSACHFTILILQFYNFRFTISLSYKRMLSALRMHYVKKTALCKLFSEWRFLCDNFI